jgi:hypothetical protein
VFLLFPYSSEKKKTFSLAFFYLFYATFSGHANRNPKSSMNISCLLIIFLKVIFKLIAVKMLPFAFERAPTPS